uniref:Uncharacterized protein n=1 Tax=Magallana gigas TaxID=29159 RepID=K1RUH7_MAGGI
MALKFDEKGLNVFGETGHSVPGTQYGDHNGIMVDYIGYEKCRGKIFTLSIPVCHVLKLIAELVKIKGDRN